MIKITSFRIFIALALPAFITIGGMFLGLEDTSFSGDYLTYSGHIALYSFILGDLVIASIFAMLFYEE